MSRQVQRADPASLARSISETVFGAISETIKAVIAQFSSGASEGGAQGDRPFPLISGKKKSGMEGKHVLLQTDFTLLLFRLTELNINF